MLTYQDCQFDVTTKTPHVFLPLFFRDNLVTSCWLPKGGRIPSLKVDAKVHNFNIPLVVDNLNMMTVMQKLKIYARINFCYKCRVSA